MRRVPSDVVKCVFHFLGSSKFEADVSKIHKVFFKMFTEIDELYLLTQDIIFEDSNPFPYSETISYALDRLQKSNLLHCGNPRLDQFEISHKLAEQSSVEELFEEQELRAIKQGADFFKSAFKISEHVTAE